MREHAELMGQLKESFRSDHDVQGVQQVTTLIEEMSTAFAKRQQKASTAVAGACCKKGQNAIHQAKLSVIILALPVACVQVCRDRK